jgi:hypothetical protein
MRREIDDTTVDKILELGKLALLFGRTDRTTYHDDQETAESDTDHTVMLSLSLRAHLQNNMLQSLTVGTLPNLHLSMILLKYMPEIR